MPWPSRHWVKRANVHYLCGHSQPLQCPAQITCFAITFTPPPANEFSRTFSRLAQEVLTPRPAPLPFSRAQLISILHFTTISRAMDHPLVAVYLCPQQGEAVTSRTDEGAAVASSASAPIKRDDADLMHSPPRASLVDADDGPVYQPSCQSAVFLPFGGGADRRRSGEDPSQEARASASTRAPVGVGELLYAYSSSIFDLF